MAWARVGNRDWGIWIGFLSITSISLLTQYICLVLNAHMLLLIFGEGSEKTDLNWLFSMVASFFLLLSSFQLLFSGAAHCVPCFLCVMNPQNHLLLSCMAPSSFGDITLFMYDQYVFVQIHCRFCTFGMLYWIYFTPFWFSNSFFCFIAASLVHLLSMAPCLLFWLSFLRQSRQGHFNF